MTLPNDVFKRPGPHHAYEVDPARLATLRAALDVYEELGERGPLAALLGQPAEELAGWVISSCYHCCLVGNDFGLRSYGPMFERMDLAVRVGEPLFPQRDARVAPVSHVWFEEPPYLPQLVSAAREVEQLVASLHAPPEAAWERLLHEVVPDDAIDDLDEVADPDEALAAQRAQARPMLERWRAEARAEVEAFALRLRELTARDALVATWFDDQGWL